ncbi:MAG: hypothetical protein HYT63_00835 [Candidatus Yanofskybacteria bacterium]|nr:hypothetical protein [Candidatus Yanofskybacteria bacterium]
MSNLAKYRDSSLEVQTAGLGMSEAFKQNLENLKRSKTKIQETQSLIRDVIDPSKKAQAKYKLARLIKMILPQSLQFVMPEGWTQLLTEKLDPLQKLDSLFRLNINTTQGSATEMIADIKTEKAKLEKLRTDIEAAEREGWDAQKLQEYVAARNNIAIQREISEVFKEELDLLTPEDREVHRQEIISSLKADVINSEALKRLYHEGVSACVKAVNYANLAYHSFSNIVKPAIVFRDVAENLASLNASAVVARDAVLLTIESSSEVFEEVLNSFNEAEKNRITSVETLNRIEQARLRIAGKLESLRITVRNKNQEMILEGEFEEINPLQLTANSAEKSPN